MGCQRKELFYPSDSRVYAKSLSGTIRSNQMLVFTPREKQIRFGGLTLVVAPDLIFRWEEDGTRYIGCLKLRIKKKAAEFGVYRRIASLLAHYLKCIAADDEVVVNNFCLCYNAMDGNIIPAPRDLQSDMEDLRIASEQIVELWNVA